MVNFQMLKNEVRRLNGTAIGVSTKYGFFTIDKAIVMDYDENGLAVCNVNHLLEGLNSINFIVKEHEISDYEVSEVFEDKEVRIYMKDGSQMVLIELNT